MPRGCPGCGRNRSKNRIAQRTGFVVTALSVLLEIRGLHDNFEALTAALI